MKSILEIKMKYLGIVAVVCLLFCATSCIKDDHLEHAPKNGKGLSFELNIPATTQVPTRSVASSAELEIKDNSYLIVFNKDGAYYAHEEITAAKIAKNTNGTKSPKINLYDISPSNLPDGAKLVFILNAQSTHTINDSNKGDYTYATINTKFPLADYGLATATEIANKGIPMYGELIGWSIATDTGASSTPIPIKRSVAKLQVQVSATIEGTHKSNFATPANVKYQLYNYAKNGMFKESGAGELTDTDVNSAPTITIADETIIHSVAVVGSEDADSKGAVYLTEYPYSTKIIGVSSSTDVLVAVSSQNRLAIIVKSSDNSRFYRLDLCDSGPEYVDILRNHHYRIVITKVNDNGYESADAAFNAPASNVEYEIIDDSGHTTIGNGKYAISVGEEMWGGKAKSIIGSAAVTFEVATNVRWVLPAVVSDLPIDVTSAITVVDNTESETPIAGATASPTVLTGALESLKLTLPASNEGSTVVRFKITLGTLEYLSEAITIKRTLPIVPAGGGLDCIPSEATFEYNVNDITWDKTGDYNLFTIIDNGNTFTVKVGENLAITGWKTWNYTTSNYEFSDDEKNVHSIPRFEAKYLNGALEDGSPIVIKQPAPYYIGRYGSPDVKPAYTYGAHKQIVSRVAGFETPLRKRAIVHTINIGTTMAWGPNSQYYTPGFNEENDGLAIMTNKIVPPTYPALYACSQLNDGLEINKWYLPATQQLIGAWVGISSFEVPFSSSIYWSATDFSLTNSWYLNFIVGNADSSAKTTSPSVRCVRDL